MLEPPNTYLDNQMPDYCKWVNGPPELSPHVYCLMGGMRGTLNTAQITKRCGCDDLTWMDGWIAVYMLGYHAWSTSLSICIDNRLCTREDGIPNRPKTSMDLFRIHTQVSIPK